MTSTDSQTSELQQLNALLHQKDEKLRQMEAALRASEERYALSTGPHSGRWNWNIANDEIEYSPHFRAALGYVEAEDSRRLSNFKSGLHPADCEKVLAAVQQHLVEKVPYDVEYRLRTEQDSYRWVHACGQAVWNDAGEPVRMSGSITDITDRKQIETQLKHSLKELTDIKFALDQSSIVAVTDVRGKILEVNDRFCQIAGYSRSDLIGNTHRLINSGYHSADFFKEMWKTIVSGKVWRGEIKNKTKANSFYWVDTTIVPILDFSNQPIQFIAIRNDITERKQVEESLRQLNEELETKVHIRTEELEQRAQELERSNAELQQFAYVASHDLQEPLRTINSFTELLAQEYGDRLDEEAQEYIKFIVDGSLRMQQLIKDLLAYSRVDSRGKAFATTDCEKVLQRVISNLKFAIEESQASITHDPLPHVFADESQVQQLFQNLLSNALKFRAENPPHVHISAEPQDDRHLDQRHESEPTDSQMLRPLARWWQFCVSDNGIGVEPNYREQIFEIFQRLHSRRIYAGTGIGLAICRKIVQRHGGRIWVEASAKGGAAFYFTLPDRAANTRE